MFQDPRGRWSHVSATLGGVRTRGRRLRDVTYIDRHAEIYHCPQMAEIAIMGGMRVKWRSSVIHKWALHADLLYIIIIILYTVHIWLSFSCFLY